MSLHFFKSMLTINLSPLGAFPPFNLCSVIGLGLSAASHISDLSLVPHWDLQEGVLGGVGLQNYRKEKGLPCSGLPIPKSIS